MRRFLLTHRHEARECRAAFAAWSGFDSPLRRNEAMGTCLQGGHALWWTVEARDEDAALALLPPYVAARTEAVEIRPVPIP